ncbi:hypothetical protein [Novosphingobium mangrovi (ex Huang et al. 2023)]|uniref:Glycosyl transferase n=1 Tax=Novosphingobium mangrovi (ex Huang et al. 2023) TaxID=2976432 RepID=A0ABT2I4U2_9SPHN|nr:hypothetical protein [Novosphingobium mangrovi (ex Huang et al. 2023)]MCT2399628.1 hypothetical protein [Novosphingobium mangrovi (ex Huang et al. 2023)]
MRIGFLFNHDQIHQVAHSLPIAMALANGGFSGEIVVATTTPALVNEVRRIGGNLIGTRIEHVELAPSGFSRSLDAMFGKVIPAHKLLIYRDNLDFFRGLDILVVAEKTSLILKSRYGLKNLAIIHTRHGAGDRAIGFDKASAGFDHVLCSGPKIRDRLIREAGVSPQAITVVGYPKFDLVRDKPIHRFLPTAEKVVLYNPHPSPHLSSWYRHGVQVLDRFQDDPRYGLIFAPHVMLFQRSFVLTIDKLSINSAGAIPQRLLRGDNMKFDLGSRASTDMTYTLAADIYLGDASSQVYEFLLHPRPCIFLNSPRLDWVGDPNFLHWEAGEVIVSPEQLPAALARAEELHETRYRAVQEEMFAASFDITATPSSVRAASAIVDFAHGRTPTRTHLRLVTA